MSLGFLPNPLYVLFCFIAFVMLIFFAISRRKKDRKELLAAYITLSLCTPFMAFGRLYERYYELTTKIVYAFLFILFIELTVMVFNDFIKGKFQIQVLIGLILIWTFVVFIILILFHII